MNALTGHSVSPMPSCSGVLSRANVLKCCVELNKAVQDALARSSSKSNGGK
jgi:hypothetical protein